MPYERDAEQIIGDWRRIVAMLANVPHGSVEADRLHRAVELLRDEYAMLSLTTSGEVPPFPAG